MIELSLWIAEAQLSSTRDLCIKLFPAKGEESGGIYLSLTEDFSWVCSVPSFSGLSCECTKHTFIARKKPQKKRYRLAVGSH